MRIRIDPSGNGKAGPAAPVAEAPRRPRFPALDALLLGCVPGGASSRPGPPGAGAYVERCLDEEDVLDLLAPGPASGPAIVPDPMPEAAPRKRVARSEERVPTSWIAMVHLPTGEEIPCNIKDVSKSGAKIGIPERVPLTERFVLRLIGRDMACRVRVAWRKGNYVGLRIEAIHRLGKAA